MGLSCMNFQQDALLAGAWNDMPARWTHNIYVRLEGQVPSIESEGSAVCLNPKKKTLLGDLIPQEQKEGSVNFYLSN